MLSLLFRQGISNLISSFWVSISQAMVEKCLLQGSLWVGTNVPFTIYQDPVLQDHSCWAVFQLQSTRLCVLFGFFWPFFFLPAFVLSIVFYQRILRLSQTGVHDSNLVWQLRDSTDMIRPYRKMRKIYILFGAWGTQNKFFQDKQGGFIIIC